MYGCDATPDEMSLRTLSETRSMGACRLTNTVHVPVSVQRSWCVVLLVPLPLLPNSAAVQGNTTARGAICRVLCGASPSFS